MSDDRSVYFSEERTHFEKVCEENKGLELNPIHEFLTSGSPDSVKRSFKEFFSSDPRAAAALSPEPWPWRCCTGSLRTWPADWAPRPAGGCPARGTRPGWPRRKPPGAAG